MFRRKLLHLGDRLNLRGGVSLSVPPDLWGISKMAASNSILGVVLLLVAAVPAVAAAQTAPRPRHLGAIDACRAIAADTARLACFDREATALLAATASGQVSVVDRADMIAARRSLFGFSLPRLPFFSGDRSAEDNIDQIESTIRSVQEIERGRYRMVLTAGNAVWETTESTMRLNPPRSGDKIVIKKAALGSYFLRIGGQVGIKGQRVK